MNLEAIKILPNYTYDDYCSWEGRWELIDGIPYAMSPMPNPKHQWISSELNTLISIQIKENKCDCKVYQPIDVKLNEHTVLNPDLLIVCEPIHKQFLDFPPKLVVEILSPSTRLKDLNTKYYLYQNFKVKYYLIVDPETETYSLFILKEDKYQKVDSPVIIELNEECKFELDLSTLF